MSFEDDKLSKAILRLKEVEKRCSIQAGWIKSLSQKVFGTPSTDTQSLAEQLETQIILADSQVCIAILTFLQQDLSGYFKGGWVLRKAWKVYQRTYKEILTLYKGRVGELQLPDPILSPLSPPSPCTRHSSDSEDEETSPWDVPEQPVNGSSQQIDKTAIMRLMEAISFGYGLFQLGVSLLPPSLAKLLSVLGFAANRQNGISCLMYARLGMDMRAPLASLALLWYHTIVRPFYAIDGTNVQAGVEAANILIQESKQEFGDSALFLFFAGRAARLNSDVCLALSSFQKALENASHREIKMLCLHEIGWCHLIELDYQNAKTGFLYLKNCSRWSRSFYCYLSAICLGSIKDYANYQIFNELQESTATTKSNQLNEFLSRRIRFCPKDGESAKQYSVIYFKLLVFEMLYLWNALASCSLKKIDLIIEDCSRVELQPNGEPRNGLAYLIKGSAYGIRRNNKVATECFRKCLGQRSAEAKNAEDAHISAFAQYELGHILIQDPQTKEEGKLLLQQVSQYDQYDFEGRLNVRIHSILRQLDN
ncbi:tetratricopeptide repeat protein 39C-like isoform X2 [Anthonomus grandis grandis]|nr:tetratricopeptide repeat protein 39C-like isoform X2 [Anthonomus grandis grandis]